MTETFYLPQGWIDTELGDLFSAPGDDIVDGPFGSNLKAAEYVDAGIPIARLQNIDRNRFVSKNIQYVSAAKADELARHTFRPGDVLVTKLGDPLGKACLAPDDITRGVLVADVVRARLTHQWVDRRFLCYQINSTYIVEQFKDQTKGTTRPRVNLTKIRALRARLCPLPEQIRIVAKLEELLTDLDAGVAELKAAQKKLQQYRQSLLKAAVEGALTANWRDAQRSPHGRENVAGGRAPGSTKAGAPIGTGAQMLARILIERRARWEAARLAKFKEQGKAPPKDWQKKYPEPLQPDTSDLPALPEGWVWATVDQCALDDSAITDGPFGSNLKSEHYRETGPRVIRLQNIGDGVFVDSYAHISEARFADLHKHSIETNDIVVAMLGENLPRACEIPDGVAPAIVKADCARIRLNTKMIRPAIVVAQLNSKPVRDYMMRFVKGIGRPRINLGHVRAIPVALPPNEEQSAIENALRRGQLAIEAQFSAIELSVKQSAAQRQSIFLAAFAGKLVSQDSNDEPAIVLLDRIRNERVEYFKRPKVRKLKKGRENVAVVSQLMDVLAEAADWMPAHEAFRRCGVADGAPTEQIESLYAELRNLDKVGRLVVEPVTDAQGRKLYDRLRLLAG